MYEEWRAPRLLDVLELIEDLYPCSLEAIRFMAGPWAISPEACCRRLSWVVKAEDAGLPLASFWPSGFLQRPRNQQPPALKYLGDLGKARYPLPT